MSRATKVLGILESSIKNLDSVDLHEASVPSIKTLRDLESLRINQTQALNNIITAASKQSFFVPSASEDDDDKLGKIIKANVEILKAFISWAGNIT